MRYKERAVVKRKPYLLSVPQTIKITLPLHTPPIYRTRLHGWPHAPAPLRCQQLYMGAHFAGNFRQRLHTQDIKIIHHEIIFGLGVLMHKRDQRAADAAQAHSNLLGGNQVTCSRTNVQLFFAAFVVRYNDAFLFITLFLIYLQH